MTCRHCSSTRIASVSGKCSDMSDVSIGRASKSGYMPDDLGVGGGDYIDFGYCLDCGMLQGTFPRPLTAMEKKAEASRLTKAEEAFARQFMGFVDENDRTDLIAVVDALPETNDMIAKVLYYLRSHNRVADAEWIMDLIEDLDAFHEIADKLDEMEEDAED